MLVLDGVTHYLPSQPTTRVGRAEDILRARHELSRDEVRLLTLTGRPAWARLGWRSSATSAMNPPHARSTRAA
jgi:hypothetical protein